ncbi:hypothetical protein ABZ816_31155 [Actinosynnema sp. NPDC047251]|uniref:Uncharacterized protein n=1 Tax=Saccharothrix espanaensis (strain ATCC 51144 / DSM 44229 / JCM 9112 / NBRC 15066 / NRRL 15764) TaxID=1179773 RepID=K0K849_SACES|nr:hypothetical protein [Saccharothrix espanaensis]CCH32848.1 hypothetical protein BN6_55890 [Saccharothrix espanaensis DSM 44229]
MSDPDRLALLWKEHVRAPFPPHLRRADIDGEDTVLLDADIGGCVSGALSRPLDERRRRALVRCLMAAAKALPSIGDGRCRRAPPWSSAAEIHTAVP